MTVATYNLFTPSDKLRQSLSTPCKHRTDIFKHSKLSNTRLILFQSLIHQISIGKLSLKRANGDHFKQPACKPRLSQSTVLKTPLAFSILFFSTVYITPWISK